jgi:hypothetical protein
MKELIDTFHALVFGNDAAAECHKISHRLAVACSFKNCLADQRNRFRIVELGAPITPSAGKLSTT